jgi:hypothetical protein
MPRAFDVPPDARDYADKRLAILLDDAAPQLGDASLRLVVDDGRADAKVRVTVGHRVVRARVVGTTTEEAIERVAVRVASLVALATTADTPRPTGRRARTWEFGEVPVHRPPYRARRPGERGVVRRKRYDVSRRTTEDAIVTAALLDHDFFLFGDARTSQPSVVRRDGRRWTLAEPTRCALDDAVELLDVSNARFLFFVDGAGALQALYRRYDGNYGLLSPEPSPAG